jgi:hypothetical protein
MIRIYILCFIIISLIAITRKRDGFSADNIYAIHSIFIAKENILFLEQWIDYHIQLGFNKFYLYDNSKVTKLDGNNIKQSNFKPGKLNKYNVNYDELVKLSDNEISEVLIKIQKKYKMVEIIEWSPKDNNGNIVYGQLNGHNKCLKQMKKDNVKWCAVIDMDEFIVIQNGKTIQEYINKLNSNTSNIILKQIRFDSRFNNLNKLIININGTEFPENKYLGENSPKNIFRVKDTTKLSVHFWEGHGKQFKPNESDICFNHYKMNNTKYKLDNINIKIKKILYDNSKKYLKIN